MNNLYHEKMERGTPDFPLEIYVIDSSHPRYKMQMHWHKEFEIIRVTKGMLKLKLNENDFILRENQSVFVPGGILHSADPTECSYECIVFSPSILYSVQSCRSIIKSCICKAVVYDKNENINRMFSEMKSRGKAFQLEVSGRLCLIAADIINKDIGYGIKPNEKLEKIKPAMLFIEENYPSKITLNILAGECRLSPNYFCRYFKETVGQTPFEYISLCRIEAACEMFACGNKNVTEVCYSCGFNDLSYFIHVFKKHKGMSPRMYIKTACK